MLVGSAELVEQIEGLVEHPLGARARTIDLVDDDDGFEPLGEGLARYETGLGHGPVHGIHQQQHGIDHGQHAFDLAAEVGMAGGVDNIDAVILPTQGGVLGGNGDPAFLFQVVGVHDAGAHLLVRREGAGLLQELIHQSGLAMIDVGDNGDIT